MSEANHRAAYLKKGPYNSKLQGQALVRVRGKNRELGHDMIYGDRTENERINKAVDNNALRDPTVPRDRSMIIKPDWKPENKNKWVSVVELALQRKDSTRLLNISAVKRIRLPGMLSAKMQVAP